ncbi:MAG: hypothetical protein ACKO6F_10400 [Cyanobium sp.]
MLIRAERREGRAPLLSEFRYCTWWSRSFRFSAGIQRGMPSRSVTTTACSA